MVILSKSIYVYDLATREQLVKLETVENLGGVAAVNTDKSDLKFACHTTEVGQIQVIDFDSKALSKAVIKAHKSHVSAITLNWQGKLVATASVEGQVIRVYKTGGAQELVHEFRRGNDQCTIQCINFDTISKWMTCTSEKGTVHVFAIDALHHSTSSEEERKKKED